VAGRRRRARCFINQDNKRTSFLLRCGALGEANFPFWEIIEDDYCLNFYHSMSRKLAEVVNRNDAMIKY
jgi:hypothetical protein